MLIHLLHLHNMPIFAQLQLEEALLRLDCRNFFIINEGSTPAIVMGISGKAEELIHLDKAQEKKIPVIKRFSGGGTVIVDKETIFTTFICQKSFLPIAAYPEPILQWTAAFYNEAFPLLTLKENDYVIGKHKCGGNAQYIQKERWLQHTSFLWDYSPEHMSLLKHPKKVPAYRDQRGHLDFLTPLKAHAQSKQAWIENLKTTLQARFAVEQISLNAVLPLCKLPHRQTTEFVLQP